MSGLAVTVKSDTHRIEAAVAAVVKEGLKKFPDQDFVEKPEGLTEPQLALLGALGVLLHLWPDQETALSIKIKVGGLREAAQICYCPNPHPPPKMIICQCP